MILYSVAVVSNLSLGVPLMSDVGTTRWPTKHGFSGIPVRFLFLMWEGRASLEKTLSLQLTTDSVESLCVSFLLCGKEGRL